MLDTRADIFDLILGPISGTPDKSSAASPDGQPLATPFGDVLQQMLAMPNGSILSVGQWPTEMSAPDTTSNDNAVVAGQAICRLQGLLIPTVECDGQGQILPQDATTNVSQNSGQDPVVQQGTGSPLRQIAGDAALAAIPQNIVDFNLALRQQLPVANLAHNDSLCAARFAVPVELQDGCYSVRSWQVSGDSLQMELVGEKDTQVPIQVRLPLDTFDMPSVVQPQGSRIALDSATDVVPDLKKLLADLNLTELIVTGADSPQSDLAAIPSRSVRITAVAQQESDSTELTGVIDRKQLMAVMTSAVAPAELVTEQSQGPRLLRRPSGAEGRRVASTLSAGRPSTESSALDIYQTESDPDSAANLPTSPERAQISLKSQVDRVSVDLSGDGNGESSTAGRPATPAVVPDATPAPSTDSQEMPAPRPSAVRFHIPDNLSQLVRHQSQSLLIRIEPEHLGPARLHLSEHGGQLRARLVVETESARALIEGSLDKLKLQLEKAAVKVEHLEVTVANDAAHRFFERQPRRNQSLRNKNMADTPGAITDTTATDSYVPPSSNWSAELSPGSVNILA